MCPGVNSWISGTVNGITSHFVFYWYMYMYFKGSNQSGQNEGRLDHVCVACFCCCCWQTRETSGRPARLLLICTFCILDCRMETLIKKNSNHTDKKKTLRIFDGSIFVFHVFTSIKWWMKYKNSPARWIYSRSVKVVAVEFRRAPEEWSPPRPFLIVSWPSNSVSFPNGRMGLGVRTRCHGCRTQDAHPRLQ